MSKAGGRPRYPHRFASDGLCPSRRMTDIYSAVKHLVPTLLSHGRGRAPCLQVRPLQRSFLPGFDEDRANRDVLTPGGRGPPQRARQV
jgi:hypothetical protein